MKRPILDREAPIRSWASAVSPDPDEAGERLAPRGVRARRPSGPDRSRRRVRGPRRRRMDPPGAADGAHARRRGSTAGWADTSGRMFRTASDAMAAWWAMFGMPQPNGGAGLAGARPEPGATIRRGAARDSAGRCRAKRSAAARPRGAEHRHPPPAAACRLEITSRRPGRGDRRSAQTGAGAVQGARSACGTGRCTAHPGDHARSVGTPTVCVCASAYRTISRPAPTTRSSSIPCLDCAVGTVTLKIPD